MRADILLLVCALGLAPAVRAADDGETSPDRSRLHELARPALERQEPAVQHQLAALRHHLDELLERADTPATELAEAFGRLGRLYFLYDIDDLATLALENAETLAPNDYQWHYFLAVHRTFSGELDEAEKELRRVLELRPGYPQALLRLGDILVERDHPEEAADLYRQVVDLEPLRAAALAGLARVAEQRKQPEEVVKLTREALELQPEADALYYLLGMAYRSLGDRENARAALQKNKHGRVHFEDPLVDSLSLENASAEAHFQAASDAMRRGDFERAIGFYQSYLEIKGEDPEAYHNMGVALLSTHHWDEGMAALRKAVELKPDYRGAQYSLASALAEEGNYDEALPHYRRAHELDPAEPVIHSDYATLLAKLGRTDEALAELEQILQDDPLQYYARLKYGTVLAQVGRTAEARQQLEQVSESGGLGAIERGEAHYHLGLLAQARGDLDEARSHLQKSATLAPKVADYQLAWGEQEARDGRFGEAADTLQRAVQIEPDNERAQMSRGMALLLAEQYPRARQALEEGLEHLPQSSALAEVLARLLAACPDASVRDGARAVQIAQQLVDARLTLDRAETLAMALAEAGRFEEAVSWQEQLIQQAERVGKAQGAAQQRRLERLEGYRQGRPARAPWKG